MKEFIRKIKTASLLLVLILAASPRYAMAQFDGGVEDAANIKVIGQANGGTVPFLNGNSVEISFVPGFEQSKKITNIVRLSLFEETNKYLSQDFTANVQVLIQYGPNASTLYSHVQNFTVNYKVAEGTKYDAKNYFHFEGAEFVRITLQSYTPLSSGGVNLSDILLLENEMRVTRYFQLQPNITPTFISYSNVVSNPADGLDISWVWPVNSGHNATQLEWTWLEDELQQYYYVNGSLNHELLFKNNSTRVDLPYGQNSYKIPLFYDGVGKLYYRLRPVNFLADGTRRDGQWTLPHPSWGGICSYSGHNNNLNWQVRTSFAEEGKLKSVMEYFDGSLRSRQTVTKENVNNTTVTAETLYDYEGRPAIQILPTPGMNNIIQYQAGLNLFNTQTTIQNHAEHFDLQPIASASSLTPALSISNGSSRYYSPSNPETLVGNNKSIPDAEGYPYTVTRYTPDATGRIMSQSGVGPAHKMSSGRETKYYYGSAAQEELDGLFGTEVGNKSHYFKNMVKDANGQMSVSYTDMHGRTIATALAGFNPSSLVPLVELNPADYPNQGQQSMTRNLLDKNSNIEKGNVIESINTLLVPFPTDYVFRYELNPQSLDLTACNGTPICYECLYDLEISITDESGETAPLVYVYKNLNFSGDVDDNCSTHNPFNLVSCPSCTSPVNNVITFTKNLEAGSYSIRKSLKLSESSLQKYKDLYLQPGKGICKTEQQVIDSVYNVLLTTTNCNIPVTPTCQSCLASVGDLNSFMTAYLTSINHTGNVSQTLEAEITAAFNAAIENCNRLCNTSSQLPANIRQLMLADMMPYGGQYATETAPDPLVLGSGTTMFNKYNIFRTGQSGQPFYKSPRNSSQQLDYYRTLLNAVDEVVHPGGSGYSLLNTMPVTDFVNQFIPSWANSLLPYHPEYPRLQYVEGTLTNNNVYNWINTFNSTTTYAAAQTNGYIMTDYASVTDPLYNVAPSLKSSMVTWVTDNYAGSNLSLWQMARGEVKCRNITDGSLRLSCYVNGSVKVPPFADVTSTSDKDQMWSAFQNLYAGARDKQLSDHIAALYPLADATDLINQGFKLRFGTHQQIITQSGGNYYPTTIGTHPPNIPPNGLAASNTTQVYTNRCNSYIDQWKTALLQCGPLASMTNTALRDLILTQITNGMATVCLKGSDAANPFGSSTVNPSTPNDGSHRSFEEVINYVYQQYGIARDYTCNPFVIEFPKPYGKGPKMMNELTSMVDSCACANFALLKTNVTAAGYNPNSLTSINSYLQLNGLEILTNVLHQALLNCSSYTQQVCGTVPTTASCYDPLPCDYMCFPRTARTNLTEAVPTTCGEWYELIACFYDIYGNTVNSDPATCQNYFVSHFNSWYQAGYNWTQIDSLYQSTCGATLNVCVSCFTTVQCGDPQNCQTVFAPYQLSSPQPLPEYLKCGGWPAASRCLTCDKMAVFTDEFKAQFTTPYNGGPIFTGTDLTPVQIEQNVLYARFLNFRTGLQLTWSQYADAAAEANCNPLAGGGVVDLTVNSRSGNTPAQYIASNSILFMAGFESGVNDNFETLIQYNGTAGTQVVICRDPKAINDTTGYWVIDPPCHRMNMLSISWGQSIYQQQQLILQANFEKAYREKCMAAKDLETFTVTYSHKEYHYTLYYYDMAGNLVKTVPPKGVRPDFSTTHLNNVKTARQNGTTVLMNHLYVSQHRFNSLNKVIAQNSPDASTSKFWYDRIGRLAVSQTAQQGMQNKYSYTKYDPSGRITEVGQKPHLNPMSQVISQDDALLNNWINSSGSTKEQITYTVYDLPYMYDPPNPPGLYPLLTQQNLRNRISHVFTKNLATDAMQYTASFYSYDIHGNVEKLLQDYKGIPAMDETNNRFKMINYDYDLISGKVNIVNYQPDWYNEQTEQWVTNPDRFFHKYKYDGDNRLIETWTSRDKVEWERDAEYKYFKHGLLSRTVLGKLQVQGLDNAYTLHGWLKGVNSTSLGDGIYDIGNDGFATGTNTKVARDIFGFGLHYFDNTSTEMDYKAIGSVSAFARPNNILYRSLYNGNISAISLNNLGLAKVPSPAFSAPLLYNYQYDQLNRLSDARSFNGFNSNSNSWTPNMLDDYRETISYDPNGNIKTLLRLGAPSTGAFAGNMDQLTYNYHDNTNQLRQVNDGIFSGHYQNDIDDQPNFYNYQYDASGNLKTDASEQTTLYWTVYGKVSHVIKNYALTLYGYDAGGNRIAKTNAIKSVVYVRDARGNVMSVYEKPTSGAIDQSEIYLYGSNRLGLVSKLTVPQNTVGLSSWYGQATVSTFTRGEKNFELSNHLGNVIVTVSDRKIAHNSGNGTIDYYNADVISASDYYSFGFDKPGRIYGTGRYGFNGKERDKEISGLTAYDYGFRIYNGALGRFLSVDPLVKSYPWYSPYHFAGNNPIHNIDLDGLEECSFGHRLENQWIPALMSGKMTEEQYLNNLTATAIGGAVGIGTALVAADLTLNQGRVTSILLKSTIFLNICNGIGWEHSSENTKNPQLKKEQQQMAMNSYLSAMVDVAGAKLFGVGFNAVSQVIKVATKRFNFALKFYKNAGYAEASALREINGIELTEKVYEITLKKGTKVEQWLRVDAVTGKPIPGNYYVLPGADPTKLGISLEGRIKVISQLKEDTKFLKSTAADIKDTWTTPGKSVEVKGGEIQLFQTNVKKEILD